MVTARDTLVRRFDGSLADARGLLRVERATFDESPYDADEVQSMLAGGSQRAWLATMGDDVLGFIIAFPTYRLEGLWWEMDLLAVDPEWTRRGLGWRLIHAAASGGSEFTDRARAVVATDNVASARAFGKAGFQPALETQRLLIYRTGGRLPRSRAAQGVEIQETAEPTQALEWLINFGPGTGTNSAWRVHEGKPANRAHGTSPEPVVSTPGQGAGSTCLLAGGEDRASGFAELVAVQTLLYSGLWIESLVAPELVTRRALIDYTLEKAKMDGLDEVGAMVPEDNWSLQQDLLAEGFRSLGDFHWYTADLPIPDPATTGSEEL
jgi:ribosomal protein S18 acetylase RimI-like enzyme